MAYNEPANLGSGQVFPESWADAVRESIIQLKAWGYDLFELPALGYATLALTNSYQTVLTYQVPAGLLGARGGLYLALHLTYHNTSGGSRDYLLRVTFGGSTLWDLTVASAVVNNSRAAGQFRLVIGNQNNAAAQIHSLEYMLRVIASWPESGSPGSTVVASGPATVNTANAATLNIDARHSSTGTVTVHITAPMLALLKKS